MKKNLLTKIAAAMICAAMVITMMTGMQVKAEAAESATVKVSISDGTGVALAAADVSVTDYDGDGVLTIADALYCAHESCFDGGAEGFGAASTEYGLSMTKLWGIENGGSYGYYVNNASAWSLADPVADGDYVYAFVYSDTVYWSDTYCFFDKNTVEAECGAAVELTLHMYGYDENWNTVESPVEGAIITVNGNSTEFVTDAEGKVSVTVSEAGNCVISATSASINLVPAVCAVNVAESALGDASDNTAAGSDENAGAGENAGADKELPKTGASALVWFIGGIALIGAGKKLTKEADK